MPQRHFATLLALAAALLLTLPVLAQSAGLLLGRGTVTSGGGGSLGDPANGYALAGAVGQPVAGAQVEPDNISGGGYTLTSGFLSPSTNPQNPTVLVLVRFTVQPSDAGMRLTWTTATERDLSGFFVQRQDGGEWVRISKVIPPTGDGASGATYEYVDEDGTPNSAYRLEAIRADGTSTFYKPTGPDVQSDVQLYLPHVTR